MSDNDESTGREPEELPPYGQSSWWTREGSAATDAGQAVLAAMNPNALTVAFDSTGSTAAVSGHRPRQDCPPGRRTAGSRYFASVG